jgi:hypothetical protein
MICNIASDIHTKSLVWTVTNHATGRFVQCVPAHKVPQAMRQLERGSASPVAK